MERSFPPGLNINSKSISSAEIVVTRAIPDGVFAAGNPCRLFREMTEYNLYSLHLMASAFATENVSRFLGAFCFASSWLFATDDKGANLIAAHNLLFRRNNRFFLIFGHCQAPVRSVRVNFAIEHQDSLIELRRQARLDRWRCLPRRCGKVR